MKWACEGSVFEDSEMVGRLGGAKAEWENPCVYTVVRIAAKCLWPHMIWEVLEMVGLLLAEQKIWRGGENSRNGRHTPRCGGTWSACVKELLKLT